MDVPILQELIVRAATSRSIAPKGICVLVTVSLLLRSSRILQPVILVKALL